MKGMSENMVNQKVIIINFLTTFQQKEVIYLLFGRELRPDLYEIRKKETMLVHLVQVLEV